MKKLVMYALPVLLFLLLVAAFSWISFRQEQQMQELAKLEQLSVQQELRQELTQMTQNQQALQEQLQLQQETILQLQAAVDRLIQASRDELGDGGNFVMRCSPETFDYLAIGNSITTHDVCDYWPNVSGMAASAPEKDYFHLVSAGLEAAEGSVNSYAISLFAWEVIATDRGQMAALTDRYLTEDLDLVTVQLGENALDLSTFQNDYIYLIQHIQQLAPNAQILILGDFWGYENRNLLKSQAAEQCGVTFVSLDAIMDDPACQAGETVQVTDLYGKIYQIQHAGVSRHPSDEAMTYIAQAILSARN